MEIFDYLKEESNDSLSILQGNDLQDLLFLINKYEISYRDKLGFDSKSTFGVEIEFEKIDRKFKRNDFFNWWLLVRDTSLTKGAEINSPILYDTKVSWDELNDICSYVKQHAKIWQNCGGHVHIGAHVLGEDLNAWINFLKLWATYENVIFRFSYGEYLTSRPRLIRFAAPLAKDFNKLLNSEELDMLVDPYGIILKFGRDKYQAVNFGNIETLKKPEFGSTIEFRCANGTLNPIIWQNTINLYMKLFCYANYKDFNNNIVDNRNNYNEDIFNNTNENERLTLYKEIYLEQALELVDLIFDNNLDKINFLKQYFKSFQIGNKPLAKTKKITR